MPSTSISGESLLTAQMSAFGKYLAGKLRRFGARQSIGVSKSEDGIDDGSCPDEIRCLTRARYMLWQMWAARASKVEIQVWEDGLVASVFIAWSSAEVKRSVRPVIVDAGGDISGGGSLRDCLASTVSASWTDVMANLSASFSD